MMRPLLTALLASAIALPAVAQPTAGSADARLKALYDAEWTWRTQEFGGEGGRGGSAHLPHVDPASQQRRYTYWSNALKQLDTIPVDQLSAEEKINAAVFRTALEGFVTELRYKEYEDEFGFWTWIAPRQGFGTADAYAKYLSRLAEMPRFVDEQIANLKAGEARGFTKPKISLGERWKPIEPLAASDVATNPLYTPFAMMPASITGAEREALLARGKAAVAASAPAFGKLLAFVRDVYIPHARTATAAEALPEGKGYYAAKVRQYTTTDLTPDQIHAMGLKEVARIDADMKATMKQAGWTGDFAGFLTFLKTDPQFYAKTPYELIAKSTYVANRINGQLKYTFGLLPRFRFTIVPTPANIAPFGTGGNGGLDSCLMNTYNLPARPLYTIPPLTAHECVPGHSFQAALALEGPNRPEIRKTTYFSGYGEGWGALHGMARHQDGHLRDAL